MTHPVTATKGKIKDKLIPPTNETNLSSKINAPLNLCLLNKPA